MHVVAIELNMSLLGLRILTLKHVSKPFIKLHLASHVLQASNLT